VLWDSLISGRRRDRTVRSALRTDPANLNTTAPSSAGLVQSRPKAVDESYLNLVPTEITRPNAGFVWRWAGGEDSGGQIPGITGSQKGATTLVAVKVPAMGFGFGRIERGNPAASEHPVKCL
jgi:hypothetical protein